ncbi:hypothetical protein PtA15_4A157 [Puccinia triticina]|uniref:Uncharacterized protein n=1 Tax=Puccinia triticina TaxID=208348 RepID=A0ABY7CGC7_9BASI|nr:uncharacterized protein PtA15_4A157 [Puccinia triticina]WAQ83709.1 hypothetical protein PtA15_4A157 [Puccinia triticina]
MSDTNSNAHTHYSLANEPGDDDWVPGSEFGSDSSREPSPVSMINPNENLPVARRLHLIETRLESVIGFPEGFAIQDLPGLGGRITELERNHVRLATKVEKIPLRYRITQLEVSLENLERTNLLHRRIADLEAYVRNHISGGGAMVSSGINGVAGPPAAAHPNEGVVQVGPEIREAADPNDSAVQVGPASGNAADLNGSVVQVNDEPAAAANSNRNAVHAGHARAGTGNLTGQVLRVGHGAAWAVGRRFAPWPLDDVGRDVPVTECPGSNSDGSVVQVIYEPAAAAISNGSAAHVGHGPAGACNLTGEVLRVGLEAARVVGPRLAPFPFEDLVRDVPFTEGPRPDEPMRSPSGSGRADEMEVASEGEIISETRKRSVTDQGIETHGGKRPKLE